MSELTANAQREIAHLERVAADTARPAVERAMALLIVHQRLGDGGRCACGWRVLGALHARHQADALDRAGLLAEARP
jgi:hypothetical protein